ncbi:hypothetical protein BY458DRAFT_504559 [Sporodiniella umbellata]|nr:hypothetical protein BY458DRAFT_504559 [Sporodiniella umbellata]
MRLRVRHSEGVITLDAIEENQSILELKQRIVQTLGYKSPIQISGGYPPKTISDDTLTVQTSGLRNGDTLNLKLLDTPIQPKLKEGMVQTDHGFLILREMEDDNSCLFRSVGYVLFRDPSMFSQLRQLVADRIQQDPESFPDVVLGQDREKYIEWIQKSTSWGGAIELSILSDHFRVEIDSVDIQTGRIDRFGEGKFNERVLIVYSGIHYDALVLAPTPDSPKEFDQIRFPIKEESVLVAIKELAANLKKNHKYTDVTNFTLRCEQCRAGLKGEKDAQNHAASTGHTRFIEYHD